MGRQNRELSSLDASPRNGSSRPSPDNSEIDLDTSDIDFLPDADMEKDIVRTKVGIVFFHLYVDCLRRLCLRELVRTYFKYQKWVWHKYGNK